MRTKLPSFEAPPVVETAIAVQFDRVKGMKNRHLWEFWYLLREQFPVTEDQEPIDPKHELFGDDAKSPPHFPQIVTRPHASRLQGVSDDKATMFQIQNGRLVYNWRRQDSTEYPRWESNKPQFDKLLTSFRDYLNQAGLGSIRPNQWEVTYVNHLQKGREWDSPSDWANVVPGVIGQTSGDLSIGPLESIAVRQQYVIEANKARLYADLQSAFMAENPEQELLVLRLVARGVPAEDGQIEGGLELGRKAIVTGFTEMTSERAHEIWNRQS